jgi:hypothetical protein
MSSRARGCRSGENGPGGTDFEAKQKRLIVFKESEGMQ